MFLVMAVFVFIGGKICKPANGVVAWLPAEAQFGAVALPTSPESAAAPPMSGTAGEKTTSTYSGPGFLVFSITLCVAFLVPLSLLRCC